LIDETAAAAATARPSAKIKISFHQHLNLRFRETKSNYISKLENGTNQSYLSNLNNQSD
jgi:hypothetical protein